MAVGLIIIASLAVLGSGYNFIRLQLDCRQLIDYQLSYHKTMTPTQIRHSRRFFFKSEIQKSSAYRKLKGWNRLGRGLGIIGLVLIGLQLLDVMTFFDNQQAWFTAGWAMMLVGFSLAWVVNWRLRQQLLQVLTPATASKSVDLMMTPAPLGQQALRHRLGLGVSVSVFLVVTTLASALSILPAEGVVTKVDQLLASRPAGISMTESQATSATVSSKSQGSATKTSNDTTTTTSSSRAESQSAGVDRAEQDAAYVRTLTPKHEAYLTTQEKVGLISMYYLAITHGSPAGMEDDPSVTYTYHLIRNYQPLTIVLKATGTKNEFFYLAQIDKQNHVRLYHFTSQTPTELHGLVPAYQEYPQSKVKLGQLIAGYYSEADGAYHRTMWAMQAGDAWQY
ncbi:hypothetical protein C5Z25_03355 [Lactobacillus sp. CBA3605]|uniref:hypothetical protein n=1 Tax=Lactobacillus sp. CBA3605 TaxID=2099788 RepID=UPI000CFB8CB0|nr:hypothetical protein [Lactobacillus sp. CBA3605]AVK60846.1 hypothetical protein C5Z25_03355 [Lactobacillus sp. CBA3605]